MKRWLKRILIVLALVACLFVALFLYVNSGLFIKQQVLPRVAIALGEPVETERVSFSVFNELTIEGLRIGPADSPRIQAELLTARYQLWPLLRNTLIVEQAHLEDVTIDLTDEILAQWQQSLAGEQTPEEPEEPSTSTLEQPPTLSIRDVKLQNISGTYRQGDQTFSLRHLNATLPELASGASFEFKAETELAIDQPDTSLRATDATLTITGGLTDDLRPENLSITAQTDLSGHAGDLQVEQRRLDVQARITPAEQQHYTLDDVRLELTQRDRQVALVTLSGTIGTQPLAADLELQARLPDGEVLTTIGQLVGDYDFGRTNLAYDATIRHGETSSLSGQLDISQLSISSQANQLQDLPIMELQSQHELTWDSATSVLTIQALAATISQDDKTLGSLQLDQPTAIALKPGASPQAAPATLTLSSQQLDLRLLTPLLPMPETVNLTRGLLDASLTCRIRDNGQRLDLQGDTAIRELAIRVGEAQPLDQLAMQAKLVGDVSTSERLTATVSTLDLQLTQAGDRWLSLGLAQPLAVYQHDEALHQDAPTTLNLAVEQLALSRLQGLLPELPPEIDLSQAVASSSLSLRIADAGAQLQLQGSGQLAGMGATVGETHLQPLTAGFEIETAVRQLETIELTNLRLMVREQDASLLAPRVNGSWSLTEQDGKLTLRIDELPPAGQRLIERLAGDIELGTPQLSYLANLQKQGDEIDLEGRLEIRDLVATDHFPPLTVISDHKASYQTDQLDLQRLSLQLSDRSGDLFTLSLPPPATIALPMTETPSTIDLQARLAPFALPRLTPLIPPDQHLQLEGQAALETSATLHLPSFMIVAKGEARLEKVAFQQADASLQPIDVTLNWDTRLDDQGMLHLNDLQAVLSHQRDRLLVGKVSGQLDSRLEGRKSTLQIQAPHPVDLERLQRLYQAGEKKPPSQPPSEPPPQEPEEPFDWQRIWLLMDIKLAELRYRELTARNVDLQAELRNGTFTLSETEFLLNDSPFTVATVLDLAAEKGPAFDGKANLATLDLAPWLNSLAPDSKLKLSGGFKNIELAMNGHGFEPEQLRQQLAASLRGQLNNLDLGKQEGMGADVLESLLLGNFDMTWDDLRFSDGSAAFSWQDNTLQIPNVKMTADRFLLYWDGQVEFTGDNVPNLSVTPAFRGQLADKLREKGMKLNQDENGHWRAPTLNLQGDFWKPMNLVQLSVSYNVKLGLVDPKYEAMSSGLDAIKNLGKPSEDGKQGENVQKALKGLFDAYQSYDKAEREEDKAEEETQQPPAKKKPEDQVKDLLKLFQ